MSPRPSTLAALGLIALALCACGRRGPLETPQAGIPAGQSAPARRDTVAGSAATNQTTLPRGVGLAAGGTEPEEGDELPASALAAPGLIPTPTQSSSSRRKGLRIPPGPFPLDPLL
ncbi:LPS translocon maturation chaperone LptM [Methylobacterium oryzihabitans]|uniref:Lipoprotein n=1 Tax=Methylobacterium oryzihabitans TaxID=2499852 RepID=A0A437P551_9HYPH|nr:lipoprotein [Methylobacterium oryzihabitans]RVU17415.1 hypothetical protein EOE48_13560 [Methylobacterium oryzihabitans]